MGEQIKRLLTGREAAKRLGVSPATMRSWRKRRQGPAYEQPGGPGTQAFYHPLALMVWLDQKMGLYEETGDGKQEDREA